MRKNDAFVAKIDEKFYAHFCLHQKAANSAPLGNTHILMTSSPLEFKKIYWQRTCNSIYSYF